MLSFGRARTGDEQVVMRTAPGGSIGRVCMQCVLGYLRKICSLSEYSMVTLLTLPMTR